MKYFCFDLVEAGKCLLQFVRPYVYVFGLVCARLVLVCGLGSQK